MKRFDFVNYKLNLFNYSSVINDCRRLLTSDLAISNVNKPMKLLIALLE